ncbi:MAG: TlyA family RNA methyltransferase [Magnetococcales bacterium]|nr:TlyA family RNA methyltransferase [Magnetococcales bacterium]NGZ28273.1 TlyA family RNA methyltransferase [Magnetococcales bacterium]
MRERLDKLLVTRGLVASRQQAQRLIMAGKVMIAGQVGGKAGDMLPSDIQLELKEEDFPWASRGGLKLVHAMEHWQINPQGWTCLDVGASTGGFTSVLLAHGASKVFAVDVGYGQLAWSLSQDARVVNLERTNARYLDRQHIPDPIDFLTMDISFISVRLVLPALLPLLQPHGQAVILIKPQFEVGKGKVGKGGVVREPELRQQAVNEVVQFAQAAGVHSVGVIPSPIIGPAGNVEFLYHFTINGG